MAFLKTFLMVLIAEMGDKTQLMCMAFASRYKVRDVIIGVIAAIIFLNGLAVVLGSYLGSIIPFNYIKMVAALCFIGFGLWTIKPEDAEEEEDIDKKTNFGPIVTIAATFFVAELGDKTQLMTLALAADLKSPVMVLAGAVLGMVIADGLGIVGAAWLKEFIPDVFMKWGTAFIFLVFGAITLYEAVPSAYHRALYIIPFFILLGVSIYVIGFKLRSGENIENGTEENKKEK